MSIDISFILWYNMGTFEGEGYMLARFKNLIGKRKIKKYSSSLVSIMKYQYLVW